MGAVTADLNNSERSLTHLTALVDCKALHKSYLAATRGLCEGGLLGLLLMLIASFVAAILLTIMVWVDSHTWIYIRKRNDYAQVDEPSYVSHHQQQAAAAQMHPHNHHNNSQTMSRTLPRNHHNGYNFSSNILIYAFFSIFNFKFLVHFVYFCSLPTVFSPFSSCARY